MARFADLDVSEAVAAYMRGERPVVERRPKRVMPKPLKPLSHKEKETMDVKTNSALAAIAMGRDHISTEEFARAVCRATQTIRKNYCLTGECFGIRPIKIGNKLLWKVSDVDALLRG